VPRLIVNGRASGQRSIRTLRFMARDYTPQAPSCERRTTLGRATGG
jgi:hypothetical protein